MHSEAFTFDHIHLISRDAKAAARWYQDIFGAEILAAYELKGAVQTNVKIGPLTLIIRDRRPGETPATTQSMQHFDGYSSHNEWGTDHFGFTYHGDLLAFCACAREKGVRMAVEPWEFSPGTTLCYLEGPDGVSIELVQAKG